MKRIEEVRSCEGGCSVSYLKTCPRTVRCEWIPGERHREKVRAAENVTEARLQAELLCATPYNTQYIPLLLFSKHPSPLSLLFVSLLHVCARASACILDRIPRAVISGPLS